MAIDFDIFNVLDEQVTERVTLRKIHAVTGAATDTENVQAFPRAIAETVIDPSGVQTVVSRTTWHLRKADLASVVPDRDDRVISTSDNWAGTYVIFSVNREAAGTRFRCETQQLLS